jgi:hypothetical protein
MIHSWRVLGQYRIPVNHQVAGHARSKAGCTQPTRVEPDFTGYGCRRTSLIVHPQAAWR